MESAQGAQDLKGNLQGRLDRQEAALQSGSIHQTFERCSMNIFEDEIGPSSVLSGDNRLHQVGVREGCRDGRLVMESRTGGGITEKLAARTLDDDEREFGASGRG